jgi:hypothetical protein
VRVGEPHPLGSQAVDVRRRDLAAVALDIGVAKIVGEEHDDVGFCIAAGERRCDEYDQRDGKQGESGEHEGIPGGKQGLGSVMDRRRARWRKPRGIPGRNKG